MVTFCSLSYRLISFLPVFGTDLCFLSIHSFRYTSIYIAFQIVTMDLMNSTSCLWWVLRWFSSIFNLSAILDSVVAPSNKEFYFLFALGTICVILSISNISTILISVVAPSNKKIYFMLSVGQFSDILLFSICFICGPWQQAFSLVTTIIPFPVCVCGHR